MKASEIIEFTEVSELVNTSVCQECGTSQTPLGHKLLCSGPFWTPLDLCIWLFICILSNKPISISKGFPEFYEPFNKLLNLRRELWKLLVYVWLGVVTWDF
jgi:hypothetical protein